MFLLFIDTGIYGLQKKQIDATTQKMLNDISVIFKEKLFQNTRTIDAAILAIKNDTRVLAAWNNKDREALLAATRDYFAELRKNQKITHLYFIDTDKKVFLRVHNPGVYGDIPDRYTLSEAYRTGEKSIGLEFGIHHNFTHRNVHPWYQDGKLIGFIEMGEEIAYLTEGIANMLDAEIFVSFDKSLMSREKWEEGIKLYRHDTDWNILDHSVVLGRTLPTIPKSLEKHLDHHDPKQTDYIFTVDIDDKTYSGGFIVVNDARGAPSAKLVALRNISEERQAINHFMFLLYTGSIIFLVIFLLSLYLFLKKIESRLSLHEKKLIDAASIDPLTGIANRRYFYSSAGTIISMHDKERYLLMADIDNFKDINDRYGHDVGDKCLKKFTKIALETIRKNDLIARIGGEEFVIVFIDCSLEVVLEKAELIRKETDSTMINTDELPHNMTVSIGIATIDNSDENIDSVLKRADVALYDAKRSGKNCVKFSGIEKTN